MSQKIKKLSIILTLCLLITVGHLKTGTAATCSNPNSDKSCICSSQGCDNGQPTKKAVDCPSGKVDSQDASKCVPLGNDCNGNDTQKCLKNSAFIIDLNNIVNFLSAAVAIVVISVIIIGGIRYSLAGDNASALGEARKNITNALLALLAFIFAYAFLQWLIPGGL